MAVPTEGHGRWLQLSGLSPEPGSCTATPVTAHSEAAQKTRPIDRALAPLAAQVDVYVYVL